MAIDCLRRKLREFIEKKPEQVKLLAESGRISQHRVAESEALLNAFKEGIGDVENLLDDYARIHGNEALVASHEAAQYAYETLQRRLAFRAKEAIKVHETAVTVTTNLDKIKADSGLTFEQGIDAMHHGDVGLAVRGMLPDASSFSSRMDSYRSLYGGQISEVLHDVMPGFLTKDIKFDREILGAYAAIHNNLPVGEFSAKAIKDAQALEKWSMGMATDLERAGVDLKGRKGYLLGAMSNVEAVRKVPKEDYVRWMLDHENSIGWKNIQEYAPGVAETTEQRQAFLRHFYDVKVSNGAIKIGDYPIFRKRGITAVVNARGEHRLLQFTTSDAAADYSKKFGHGGLFETLMYLNDRHARHMALTETYTSNPGALVSEIKRTLTDKYGTDALKAIDRLLTNIREGSKVDFHDVVSPTTRAAFGATTDQFRASVLGSAFIPSYLSDAANAAIGKSMRGLPWFGDVVKSLGKLFSPKLRSDAEELAHMGYSMMQFQDAMMNSTRAPHLHWAERLPKKGLTAVMKLGLLERQTLAQRVVGLKTAGKYMADWLEGKPINTRLKAYLEGLHITEVDKSHLRDAIVQPGFAGMKFNMVDLAKLFESGDEAKMAAAVRFGALMSDVSEIAAPLNSSKAAQFWQKLEHSGATGFVITKFTRPLTSFMTSHWQHILKPIMQQQGVNRLQLLASYLIINASIGALLVQIQRLLTGKQPLPMSPELVTRAVAQFSMGPILGTLANLGTQGPILEDNVALLRAAKTALQLPSHVVRDVSKGKAPQSVGKDATAMFKYLIAGQNLWYSKLLLERYVLDQLEEAVDGTTFKKRVARRIKQEKKKKSDFWWRPGKLEPDTTPLG